MLVLAHRGFIDGPDQAVANRIGSLQQCFRRRWWSEVDIRRDDKGRFYLAHDPDTWQPDNDAGKVARLLHRYPGCKLAVNIKEQGYEKELVRFLEAHQIVERVFLFDMELVEDSPGTMARVFHKLNPGLQPAVRVSDRGEPLERAAGMDVATIACFEFIRSA